MAGAITTLCPAESRCPVRLATRTSRVRSAWLWRPSGAPRPTPSRRTGCSGAFTLVELLVVIAIITILAAMTAPTVIRAFSTSNLANCQSRLSQWGYAFHIYAVSYGGYYPHADGLDRNLGAADRCGWVDVLPPLWHETPWRNHTPGSFPGTDTLFQCPSATLSSDGAYSYSPRQDGYFSYAMNACLELDSNCPPPPGGEGWPMPSFLSLGQFSSPSRTILLFEQLLNPSKAYGGMGVDPSAGQHCGSYPKDFGERHARQAGALGGLLLHCDQHVDWKDTVWKPEWPATLEVPPRDDLDWFPY
jgi:prepilin-type N-terminal cleavage/methylation domain-containing protein